MKVLGVDPGLTGAIALVGDGYLAVRDIPTAGEKRRRVLMAAELAGIIKAWDPDTAVIEKVHAMPKQGVSSSFRFGQALGVVEGALGALLIPTEYVTPQSWKKHYRLTAHKEDARLRAAQKWPHISEQLSRKRDADRAEALLIANWKIEQ
tara:strand:+ start:2919 stop:3368 length:450 start_codon:yes stop_codon:yes gene_type:complete